MSLESHPYRAQGNCIPPQATFKTSFEGCRTGSLPRLALGGNSESHSIRTIDRSQIYDERTLLAWSTLETAPDRKGM